MIETAKRLVQDYKNITLEQLEKEWNGYGEETLSKITGFGSIKTCSLCINAKGNCDKCIHKYRKGVYWFYCIDECYHDMSDAKTPKELYEAIQRRIAYFEEIFERKQF